jgi:hypothetical protein
MERYETHHQNRETRQDNGKLNQDLEIQTVTAYDN